MRPRPIFLAVILAVLSCTTANIRVSAQTQTGPARSAFFFSAGIGGESADGATMRQQAFAAMKRMERSLKQAGLRSDDIVSIRAYLAPGQGGAVDYAGWEHAAREFFNNTKARPTRTTLAV